MTIRIPVGLVVALAALTAIGGGAWLLMRNQGDAQPAVAHSAPPQVSLAGDRVRGSDPVATGEPRATDEPPAEPATAAEVSATPPAVSSERERGLRGAGKSRGSDAPAGERWALLIGINNYAEPLPKLDYCAHDMEVLRDTLIKFSGFAPDHVRLLVDTPQAEVATSASGNSGADVTTAVGTRLPSRGNIFIELSTFLQRAKPEDTVLLAFAGHGERDAENHHYLMPTDGDPDLLEDTGLRMSRIHEYLAKCPARQKVLILDCCHSAAAARSGSAPATKFNPAKVPTGSGFVQLFSCAADQVSVERDDLKQGIFSYYLAEGLRGAADAAESANHDGLVTFEELYHYVYQQVSERSRKRQTPVKAEQVEGTIVLAVLPSQRDEPAPPSIDALASLTALEERRELPAGFRGRAENWLTLGDTFRPAQELNLLVGLLAEQKLTPDQFATLTASKARQVDSHAAAMQAAAKGRLRALVIGVNRYGGSHDLKYCVADTQLMADTLRAQSAPAVTDDDIVVLCDEAASVAGVSVALDRLIAATRSDDVLLVHFSGNGLGADKFEPPLDGGAWWLTARSDSSNPATLRLDPTARSLEAPADQALPMVSLLATLERCAGTVIVVNDCCDAACPSSGDIPATAAPITDEAADHETDKSQPALVFISVPGIALELPTIGHGVLSYAVVNGLSGEADARSPLLFGDADSDERTQASAPDGYVSVAELVSFLTQRKWLPAIANLEDRNQQLVERMPIRVVELRGKRDAAITRSAVPVE